jgi:hypothetical protein
MKPSYAALLILLFTTAAFAQAGPFDYWVSLSPGGSTGSAQIVKVVIGNNGAPGSNAGPNYDVVLTVKNDGQPVCAAGYSTQPPIQKGKQLIPLQFELVYPPPKLNQPPRRGELVMEQYVLEASINTQYPNDDTNGANGSQMKTFTFRSGGQGACKKLLGQ